MRGTAVALAVLATLTLVLPNYTLGAPGPVYAPAQLVFVAVVSLVLYGVFVFIQTVRHRSYFLLESRAGEDQEAEATPPSGRATLLSAALLLVALGAVLLLAKILSPTLQAAVAAAGLPERLAALRAARADRLQTSLNLALGPALATIGLTIPAVSGVSLLLGQDLVLLCRPSSSACSPSAPDALPSCRGRRIW